MMTEPGVGPQVGHRDDPRGVLAFESLPHALQDAEDATAVADRDNWPTLRRVDRLWLRAYVDRPATEAERRLLQHLGYALPTDLTTSGEPDPDNPTGQQPEPTDPPEGGSEPKETPNQEAARYRTQLRETQSERDALAERVLGYQRREVEAVISDRKLDRAKSAVLRWLERDGELSKRDLRPKLKADIRDQFSTALAELVSDGLLIETLVPNGSEYRLAEVHAVPEVQPSLLQVSGAVPEVHAVPPEWSLHAVADPEPMTADDRPQTARQWIDSHVLDLIANGTDTARSAEVYSAGQAAGFKLDNLRQAAKYSPLISVISRQAKTAVWRLGAGGENTIVSAPQWITSWLREQGGWHRPAEVYAAGTQAGHHRAAIKSASQAAHILKRGKSVSTEWSIDPTHQEATAS